MAEPVSFPSDQTPAPGQVAAMQETRSLLLLERVEKEKGTGAGPMGTSKTFLRKRDPERDPITGRLTDPYSIFMNVPVFLLGSFLIIGLAVYCGWDPKAAKGSLTDWKNWVTYVFTWLYIGSNGFWLFFIMAVYYYYGHIKLGKDGDKPEFDDGAYFMMIFCAGVAIGLFFFGAAEPLFHYVRETGANRYNNQGKLNDNEIATHAINITLYHWGVHGWVVYTLTALVLGILAYRYDLPLTYRTCFFPLFGKATWGWLGDVIDGFTIAGCIAGVCTSLGLGAEQIITGAQRMGWVDDNCPTGCQFNQPCNTRDCAVVDEVVNMRIYLICIITLMATASVVSGLDNGVKLLSQIAFYSGMFLLLIVFFLDSPWYLLNLMVQSFGFYLQWVLQLGWFTDAFGQLNYGEGRAIKGDGANPQWMNWWTIFYWGWWIAWSPFVGVFLARISKGRTVREVINFTFSVPLLYCIMWFSTFGGAGIKMHRKAELLKKAGTELYGNESHFLLNQNREPNNCYWVPESLPCQFEDVSKCPDYAGRWNKIEQDDGSFKDEYMEPYSTDTKLSPVCAFVGARSDEIWFDLVDHYYGLGWLLSGFSIFTIIIYFVTSSDSGSLVVDYIACNGEEAHTSTRVYWAFMEGFLAIALLSAGGADALRALQAVSICSGVPFTFFVMALCISIWDVCKYDQGEVKRGDFNAWKMDMWNGFFDLFEMVSSLGKTSCPEVRHIVGFFAAAAFPPYYMFVALRRIPAKSTEADSPDITAIIGAVMSWTGFCTCLFFSWTLPNAGFDAIAFASYLAFVVCLLIVRSEVRAVYNIEGNIVVDVLVCTFLFNQVAYQASVQCSEPLPTVKPLEPFVPKYAPPVQAPKVDNAWIGKAVEDVELATLGKEE